MLMDSTRPRSDNAPAKAAASVARAAPAPFEDFEVKVPERLGGTTHLRVAGPADAPLIETSNASHADVLDNKTLETLPSVGGNVFLMAVTVPTVQSSGDTHWNRMQDQTGASTLSVGGGGVRANNYLLDGFPITDLQNRSSTNPSKEMVDDIRVQVQTYDA